MCTECMGSVSQCATGPHDVLHWTSQTMAPAPNGPELRRRNRSLGGYTQKKTAMSVYRFFHLVCF